MGQAVAISASWPDVLRLSQNSQVEMRTCDTWVEVRIRFQIVRLVYYSPRVVRFTFVVRFTDARELLEIEDQPEGSDPCGQ